MARLSLCLPPFAGDYSGACAVLFGMDCLVVVVDAGCCTRNYVEYDETRWKGARKATFSAQLRTLDALLGDDSALVEQAAQTARDLGVSCTAVIGTPVPALVGMDLEGIAREVEAASGLPAVGVATTGFETYEVGVACALEALVGRFALEGELARDPGRGDCLSSVRSSTGRPQVNVLGATPLDFMTAEALAMLTAGLQEAGFDIAFSTAGDYGPQDVRAAGRADASIVVATAGLSTARLLEQELGIPYVVDRPFAPDGFKALAGQVRSLSGVVHGERAPAYSGERANCEDVQTVLLVGDQVAMNSLRSCLRGMLAQANALCRVQVASFFGWDSSQAEPGDRRLRDEADLEDWARSHSGAAIVGDPLLRLVPALADLAFFGLPHEAVSSTLFQDWAVCRDGEALIAGLGRFVRRLAEGVCAETPLSL